MAKTTIWLPALILTNILYGCGDGSSGQRAIDEAMVDLNAAQAGYVSREQGDLRLQDARQQSLDAAADKLRQVASDGSSDRAAKSRASRMLADIHASAARHTLRQSTQQYGEFATRSSSMLSYLSMLNDMLVKEGSLQIDEEGVIAEARRGAELASKQLREAKQRVQQIAAEHKKLVAVSDSHAAAAAAQFAKAGEYRSQAFVSEGSQKYELEDLAAAADRAGSVASFEQEKVDAEVHRLAEQLSLAETVVDVKRRAIAGFEQQADEAVAREEVREQMLADAARHVAQALQAFQEEQRTISQAFDSSVLPIIEEAAGQARQAVAAMEAGASSASRNERQLVDEQWLDVSLAQARVLTRRATIVGGYVSTLEAATASATAVPGSGADALFDELDKRQQTFDAMTDEAREAIAATRDLIGQRFADSDETDSKGGKALAQLGNLDDQLGG